MRLRKQAPHKPIQWLASRHRAGVKMRRIAEAGCREFLADLTPDPLLPARQTLRDGHPQNRSLADAGIRAQVRKTFSASLAEYSGGLIGRRDRIGIWMTILRREEPEADFPVSDKWFIPSPGIQISSLFPRRASIGDPKYRVFSGGKVDASINQCFSDSRHSPSRIPGRNYVALRWMRSPFAWKCIGVGMEGR
jgi:hypothetical protein